MNTLTTSGVKISVTTQYRLDFSSITDNEYFFNYRIDIFNENDFDIRLITREWYIFDSLGGSSIVKGQGVVGQKPIIKPGEKYSYTSSCVLKSGIGYMEGFYTFTNMEEGTKMLITIPKFKLEYIGQLN